MDIEIVGQILIVVVGVGFLGYMVIEAARFPSAAYKGIGHSKWLWLTSFGFSLGVAVAMYMTLVRPKLRHWMDDDVAGREHPNPKNAPFSQRFRPEKNWLGDLLGPYAQIGGMSLLLYLAVGVVCFGLAEQGKADTAVLVGAAPILIIVPAVMIQYRKQGRGQG